MEGDTDDRIELYDPTTEDFDVGGYARLRHKALHFELSGGYLGTAQLDYVTLEISSVAKCEAAGVELG